MLCDNCKENDASVIIEEYSNGQTRQVRLCPACAAKYQMTISFGDVFQGFLNNMEAFSLDGGSRAGVTGSVCKKCGLSYQEFKKKGKLGCAGCYESFDKELVQIFERVQQKAAHRGKIPKGREVEYGKPRLLENLRLELKKAVDNEEFEQAAQLRDKILEIEKGGA